MKSNSKNRKRPTSDSALPSPEAILDFVRENGGYADKRTIAKHFRIKGPARIPLKALLRKMEQSGGITRDRKRQLRDATSLPSVSVLRIVGLNEDGEILGEPINWAGTDRPPTIFFPAGKDTHALAPGDRVLSQIEGLENGTYLAKPIRKLPGQSNRLVGLYQRQKSGHGRFLPSDKKIKVEFAVLEQGRNLAENGDIIVAEIEARHARILERIGKFGEAKTISLMAAASYQLPLAFPSNAWDEAERAKAASLAERTDLRSLPLITIDDEDARDFDDAVFAEAREDGWRIVVAIADVAHYVLPESALDKEALRRGNSVYFPDRVVPMLPEALSNGWCSLKPKEDRPCLAVEIFLDAKGDKKSHRFLRGLMRSSARTTYREVEALHRGQMASPLLDLVVPLYGAYQALLKARKNRGTLDLDLPERRVYFGKDGHIDRIVKRERFDSHRLIEEFMIAANVCAAETLERKKSPCMYRIHDAPDPAKLEALRDFLHSLDLKLPAGGQVTPRHFGQLLKKAEGKPYQDLLNQIILRSQSQALYSPENIGHFGLSLKRYAHFTSPIRRYADLMVHRSLIRALDFGSDGLKGDEDFVRMGEHISQTERKAAMAERSAMDHFVAAFLSEKIGQSFKARITGVQRFGLFVGLEDTGADGLIPISRLPGDFYQFDQAQHRLRGQRTRRTFRLGDALEVKLVEADLLTGTLNFDLVEKEIGTVSSPKKKKIPRPGKKRRLR